MAAILAASLISCAPGAYLRTENASPSEITGTYTLLLYGGRYLQDVETLAILDREGDPYSFEIFAPEFDFKTVKGVPAKEALAETERFVSHHPSFMSTQLSRIVDNRGNTIGYEVAPLYRPTTFRTSDSVITYYRIEGSKVIVTIELRPEVRRMLDDNDRPLLFRER